MISLWKLRRMFICGLSHLTCMLATHLLEVWNTSYIGAWLPSLKLRSPVLHLVWLTLILLSKGWKCYFLLILEITLVVVIILRRHLIIRNFFILWTGTTHIHHTTNLSGAHSSRIIWVSISHLMLLLLIESRWEQVCIAIILFFAVNVKW